MALIRPSNSLPVVYVYKPPVDMRKAINGLSILVEEVLEEDPFSEHLFVFSNRRRDRVKILCWERSGFVLWHKRLEKERFHWPTHLDGDTVVLTGRELNWLLDGFDLSKMKPHESLKFSFVL